MCIATRPFCIITGIREGEETDTNSLMPALQAEDAGETPERDTMVKNTLTTDSNG